MGDILRFGLPLPRGSEQATRTGRRSIRGDVRETQALSARDREEVGSTSDKISQEELVQSNDVELGSSGEQEVDIRRCQYPARSVVAFNGLAAGRGDWRSTRRVELAGGMVG